MQAREGIFVGVAAAVITASLWGGVGLQSPPDAFGEFVVVDSVGRQLGLAHGLEGRASVVTLKVNSNWYAVRVFRGDFGAGNLSGFSSLFFTTPDCSGQAYVALVGGSSLPFLEAIVSIPGNTLYVESGPPLDTSAMSAQRDDGACEPDSETGRFVPVSPALNLDDHFTPPFSIERIPATALDLFVAN